jgi:hypothetical protein
MWKVRGQPASGLRRSAIECCGQRGKQVLVTVHERIIKGVSHAENRYETEG